MTSEGTGDAKSNYKFITMRFLEVLQVEFGSCPRVQELSHNKSQGALQCNQSNDQSPNEAATRANLITR